MDTATPTVIVSRRGADRLLAGHPWVYRSDVVSSDAAPGDIVRVFTDRKRPIAWACWSSASQIAVRALTRTSAFDESTFLRTRLTQAVAYRDMLGIDATACRLVHAEADHLPGLIVDRYGDESGDYLVVQTLTQAMDRRRDVLVEHLMAITKARGVLLRNDAKVRHLEGLEEVVAVAAGEVPEAIDVREGAIRMQVDVRHGQKTGLFLDQRENHAAAAAVAHGRALDAFTYQGGFALAMARKAECVLALDSSEAAVAATKRHAALNNLTNVEVREVNVFDELRELEVSHARFDTIVLDPPAFAKNKAALERAVAGYKEINLRAMKLLQPGGHLITCTCSHHVAEPLFLEILAAAAADAHTSLVLVEKRLQARDHPVLIGVPETSYLKCLVLRRVA